MSPTEFANYIKQRAAMQQMVGGQQQQQQRPVSPVHLHARGGGQNGDAASNYFFQQQQYNPGYQRPRQQSNQLQGGGYHRGNVQTAADYAPPQLQQYGGNGWPNYGGDFGPQHFGGSPMGPLSPANYNGTAMQAQQQQAAGPAAQQQQKMDSYNSMQGLGSSSASYRSSPYQHLLVAN